MSCRRDEASSGMGMYVNRVDPCDPKTECAPDDGLGLPDRLLVGHASVANLGVYAWRRQEHWVN